MLPDPLTIARRLLDPAERELIERVIKAGSSAASAARRETGNREKRALADRLRVKLKGTGIYAQ